jgi:hypothetical protein
MIKTQIQLPDHLFREAKRIAADYEMSFAEVVRRSLERITEDYPPRRDATAWAPPTPEVLGCHPLTDADLKAAAQDDEPRL